jgi:hypothetical protein
LQLVKEELAAMDIEVISIKELTLKWSEWVPWEALKLHALKPGGITVPNHVSGVYEAKLVDCEKRLTIGKAADLRMRVRQGLVKGKTKHSSGKDIRAHEDMSQVVVRWAETDRPAAAEEALHKRYKARFGEMPKYTDHT